MVVAERIDRFLNSEPFRAVVTDEVRHKQGQREQKRVEKLLNLCINLLPAGEHGEWGSLPFSGRAANQYNMTAFEAIKGATPRIVVVLASLRDFQQATRLRLLPDLFELRLDALCRDLSTIEPPLRKLRAPLIITARHPAEGGVNNLTASRRQELLLRFLPSATYLDLELRSAAEFQLILARVRKQKIKLIISVHDFDRPPVANRLDAWALEAALLAPDVFKIVSRTQTDDELKELVTFFHRTRGRLEISAMGVGKLGRASRIYFAAHGSALNYVHLGNSRSEGQLSLQQMRRFLAPVSNRRV